MRFCTGNIRTSNDLVVQCRSTTIRNLETHGIKTIGSITRIIQITIQPKRKQTNRFPSRRLQHTSAFPIPNPTSPHEIYTYSIRLKPRPHLNTPQSPTITWITRQTTLRYRNPSFLSPSRYQYPKNLLWCPDPDHECRPWPVIPFPFLRRGKCKRGRNRGSARLESHFELRLSLHEKSCRSVLGDLQTKWHDSLAFK